MAEQGGVHEPELGVGLAHSEYMPVLLTRRGERGALNDLASAVKVSMMPLFVVEPIPWDYDNDAPAKSVDQFLHGKAVELAQTWGTSTAFVDCLYLDDTLLSSGMHPLVSICAEAAGVGLTLLPSVGISRTSAYKAAAATVVAQQGKGACFRLTPPEWPTTAATSAVDQLLTALGLSPAEVDLVLDVGAEVAAAPSMTLTAVRGAIATLPYLADWRSLVIAGAGFPENTSGLGQGISVLPRAEWQLYQQLVGSPLARIPSYGDYVIAHPDPTLLDVNPRFMSISAHLRYTSGDTWLVAKGGLFKGPAGTSQGGAAMLPLGPQLVAHPSFMPGHCDTDQWVQNLAPPATGGNPEVWRRRGTLHHLQLVTEQLAILYAPSGSPGPSGGVPPPP